LQVAVGREGAPLLRLRRHLSALPSVEPAQAGLIPVAQISLGCLTIHGTVFTHLKLLARFVPCCFRERLPGARIDTIYPFFSTGV